MRDLTYMTFTRLITNVLQVGRERRGASGMAGEAASVAAKPPLRTPAILD
jgi:hypothetical protein